MIVLSMPMILSASRQARAAQAEGAAFSAFTAEEAAEFGAIAARIIPSDETPGATEAGAIHFMDHVLSGTHSDRLPILREGLASLQATVRSTYGTPRFSALSHAQQDALLTEIEDGKFFGTIRFLTVAGTFALPAYGGNRDGIGWKMIGFEDRHMWMPPYGFYDADYAAKGA
jgi:gluconate 2-dehydrogenase gamma chain